MTKNNEGFSIIELILYVAIVSIFITGVVVFAWGVINARQKSITEQRVIYSARLISRRINYEIRNSSGINSVGINSISLSNSDTQRNPTVIDMVGGRVRIGYGAAGLCPASSPCFLSPGNVNVQSLNFLDLSDPLNLSNVIRHEVVTKTIDGTGSLSWFYKYYSTSSAEVRSK